MRRTAIYLVAAIASIASLGSGAVAQERASLASQLDALEAEVNSANTRLLNDTIVRGRPRDPRAQHRTDHALCMNHPFGIAG